MGAKEELLAALSRRDPRIKNIHDALVSAGLKFKGPSNSQTLLYFFRDSGKEVGVAAMRGSPSVFSFPAAFWHPRQAPLQEALAAVASFDRKAPQSFISSSQYSAGQIYIKESTLPAILRVIHEIVLPVAQNAGASL
jgi:hypothetical protein